MLCTSERRTVNGVRNIVHHQIMVFDAVLPMHIFMLLYATGFAVTVSTMADTPSPGKVYNAPQTLP